MRRSIDNGLASSRFGCVVLSPAFFRKNWPQIELDGLTAREVAGQKVILPIWHQVGQKDVQDYSPSLAGKVAARSEEGLEAVAGKLIDAMGILKHDAKSSAVAEKLLSDQARSLVPLEVLQVAFTTDFNGVIILTEIENRMPPPVQVLEWTLEIYDPRVVLHGGPGREKLWPGAPWWNPTPVDIGVGKSKGSIFFPGRPAFNGSLPREPVQGKFVAHLSNSGSVEQDVDIYSIEKLKQLNPVRVEDKWISLDYVNKSGIEKELRDEGYDLYRCSANKESQLVDIEGWEPVLVPQPDGAFMRLKIRDHPAIGGYLILLKKCKSTDDS